MGARQQRDPRAALTLPGRRTSYPALSIELHHIGRMVHEARG